MRIDDRLAWLWIVFVHSRRREQRRLELWQLVYLPFKLFLRIHRVSPLFTAWISSLLLGRRSRFSFFRCIAMFPNLVWLYRFFSSWLMYRFIEIGRTFPASVWLGWPSRRQDSWRQRLRLVQSQVGCRRGDVVTLPRLLEQDILSTFVQLALLKPSKHVAHGALRGGRCQTGPRTIISCLNVSIWKVARRARTHCLLGSRTTNVRSDELVLWGCAVGHQRWSWDLALRSLVTSWLFEGHKFLKSEKRLVIWEDRLIANWLTLGEDFRILRSLVLAVAAYVSF